LDRSDQKNSEQTKRKIEENQSFLYDIFIDDLKTELNKTGMGRDRIPKQVGRVLSPRKKMRRQQPNQQRT
jgi:hypothetical protein